jgi:hypothetical protein
VIINFKSKSGKIKTDRAFLITGFPGTPTPVKHKDVFRKTQA